MARREGWISLIIVILLVFSLWVLIPIDSTRLGRTGIQYGIDLEGGVRLIYQADIPEDRIDESGEIVEDIIAVIANRVNPLGVTEPNIEKRGSDQIIVELPNMSVTDVEKDRIGRIALLEFREEVEVTDDEGNVTTEIVPSTAVIDGVEKTLNSSYFLTNTELKTDGMGQYYLYFEWDDEGAEIFEQVTTRLVGEPLYIYEGEGEDALPLYDEDGYPIAPIVQSVLSNDGTITGLSVAEAQSLSAQLNAGRLPVPLELIGELTIDPTLGQDFVGLAVKAGIIGIAAVMLFMMLYYRVPGVVATLALAFYGVLTLAIFKLMPVTMTLAGIGGFVLSVGMAVDANVLIFERIKEELMVKSSLPSAIEAGFNRAWSAIWDSNLTTIITCIVLFWVGDQVAFGGTIKGFALTLGIGVIVSLFTAIVTSRTLLRIIVKTGLNKYPALFSPYTGRKLS